MRLRSFLIIIMASLASYAFAQDAEADSLYIADDTLALEEPIEEPVFDIVSPSSSLSSFSPYFRWDVWSLHEGLNARFSFGAATGFGKGAPRGVGIEERMDLAYVKRINTRFSYAIMVHADNMTWGPMRQRNVSLTGIVGYRASEQFSLYAYVTKNIMHRGNEGGMGYIPVYGEPAVDRVGVVLDWTLGENTWIQLSVEASRVNWNGLYPFANPHQLYGPPAMRPYNW